MTLDQIETFITIAESGGLRIAAEKLHKTQPSLSIAMKNLESELSVKLFDRDGYRVGLTKEGRGLLEQARAIKFQTEQFLAVAKDYQSGREPRVQIAIDYLVPFEKVCHSLSPSVEVSNTTRLDLDFEILSGVEKKILEEDYDFGITPFLSKISQLDVIEVSKLNIVAVKSMSLKSSLSNIPQIIVKDRNPLNTFEITEISQSPRWFVSDHLIKKQMILSGAGWGHLEESSINKELTEKTLELVDKKPKALSLYLTKKQNKTLGPTGLAIWDRLIENFKR